MKGLKTIWTPEMLETLTERYATCYNKDIAKDLGLSWRTIVRKARELGLEKEPNFLNLRRDDITAMAVKNRKPNSTKGLKGWSVPGGEQYRFKPGHIPATKNNPELILRIQKKRNETISREKLRLKYNLKPLTKLRLVNFYE